MFFEMLTGSGGDIFFDGVSGEQDCYPACLPSCCEPIRECEPYKPTIPTPCPPNSHGCYPDIWCRPDSQCEPNPCCPGPQ